MKKRYLSIACACAFMPFLMAGCQGKEHSISWWKQQDAKTRNEFVAQCQDDRAKEVTPDCQNAISAKTDLKMSGDSKSGSQSPDPLH